MLRAAREYAIYGEPQSGASTIEMQLARFVSPSSSTLRGKARADRDRGSGSRSRRAKHRSSKRTSIACRWAAISTVSKRRRAPISANRQPTSISRKQRCWRRFPTIRPALRPATIGTALRARQRYVLQRMIASGDITPARATRAYAETLARAGETIPGSPMRRTRSSSSIERGPRTSGRLRTTHRSRAPAFRAGANARRHRGVAILQRQRCRRTRRG